MDLREQRQERINLDCLVERLELHPVRDAAEIGTIRSLWRTGVQHRANSIVATEATPRLITSGWAAWCRRIDGGRKVIFLFLLPGDVITSAIATEAGDYGVTALTRLRTVDAGDLVRADARGDWLAPKACALIDGAETDYRLYLLDHLSWLADGGGIRNMARLLLELHGRLSAIGRCRDNRIEIAVGQRILAQALALSVVQVNKILGQLRAGSVLSSVRGSIRIEDMIALRQLAIRDAAPNRRAPSANTYTADCVVGAAKADSREA
ncbi:hypothetical protein BH10PSE15_BH10PSE15_09120 [soil metagenome]